MYFKLSAVLPIFPQQSQDLAGLWSRLMLWQQVFHPPMCVNNLVLWTDSLSNMRALSFLKSHIVLSCQPPMCLYSRNQVGFCGFSFITVICFYIASQNIYLSTYNVFDICCPDLRSITMYFCLFYHIYFAIRFGVVEIYIYDSAHHSKIHHQKLDTI